MFLVLLFSLKLEKVLRHRRYTGPHVRLVCDTWVMFPGSYQSIQWLSHGLSLGLWDVFDVMVQFFMPALTQDHHPLSCFITSGFYCPLHSGRLLKRPRLTLCWGDALLTSLGLAVAWVLCAFSFGRVAHVSEWPALPVYSCFVSTCVCYGGQGWFSAN